MWAYRPPLAAAVPASTVPRAARALFIEKYGLHSASFIEKYGLFSLVSRMRKSLWAR